MIQQNFDRMSTAATVVSLTTKSYKVYKVGELLSVPLVSQNESASHSYLLLIRRRTFSQYNSTYNTKYGSHKKKVMMAIDHRSSPSNLEAKTKRVDAQ
jgi:hypothetical protein